MIQKFSQTDKQTRRKRTIRSYLVRDVLQPHFFVNISNCPLSLVKFQFTHRILPKNQKEKHKKSNTYPHPAETFYVLTFVKNLYYVQKAISNKSRMF